MSRSPQSRIDGSFDRRHAWVLVALSALVALMGIVVGPGVIANAQTNPFATCNPGVFRHANLTWTELERYLAAPETSGDVASLLTDQIREIYRIDGTMSYMALEGMLTPKFREALGIDCSVEGTPPATGPELPADRLAYLDQVRQVDATTVVAFIVLPGMSFEAAPGATPAMVGGEIGPDGATPYPGSVAVDAVQLVVFVQQDGAWKINYLSMNSVTFSDVVGKGMVPKDDFIGHWSVPAAQLRESGMPEFPADAEILASPVASPTA